RRRARRPAYRGRATPREPGTRSSRRRSPARDRTCATPRRRRARVAPPRPRTAAGRARQAIATSARGTTLGRRRPPEPALLPVAPFDSPFAVVERPAVHEVDERRVRSGAVVEAAQVSEHLPVSLTAGGKQPESFLRR